jgi:hypothetical protein
MTQVELKVVEGPTAGQSVKAVLQRIDNKLYYCGTYNEEWPREFSGAAGVIYIFKRVEE